MRQRSGLFAVTAVASPPRCLRSRSPCADACRPASTVHRLRGPRRPREGSRPRIPAPSSCTIVPCFSAQGGTSLVDLSRPTLLHAVGAEAEHAVGGHLDAVRCQHRATIRDDFKRLLGTNFLDNLSVDTTDYTFANGTIGKIVTYDMEERQRVKIVDYVGSKKIETSKIDDKLKEEKVELRLDTFLDEAHRSRRSRASSAT